MLIFARYFQLFLQLIKIKKCDKIILEEISMNIYAFADEASAVIDQQILALKRNNLQGLEIRNVDSVNVSDITDDKAI